MKRPLDTFTVGRLITRSQAAGGAFNVRVWICDRCGDEVELPLAEAPTQCPRCERIFKATDADLLVWVESVVYRAVAKALNDALRGDS